jgi:hypothetical protein
LPVPSSRSALPPAALLDQAVAFAATTFAVTECAADVPASKPS